MLNLFPFPSRVTEQEGTYAFGKDVYFCLDDSFSHEGFLDKAVELWSQFTAGGSVLHIVTVPGQTHTARLSREPVALQEDSTDYEYHLVCDQAGVTITFASSIGLIHGFYTLLQLLSPFHFSAGTAEVPLVDIEDRPALSFRALDVSVFTGESILFVRRLVRLAAFLKYNYVQLEFWGSIALDCNKATGWPDAFSKDEVRALVAEGMAMGVEFIPFFNHFGHASQARFATGKHVFLDQDPTLTELFEPGGWTWNVDHPGARKLIGSIREELCDLFPGKYFHIGCDEVYNMDHREDPDDKAANDRFISHINDCVADVCALGRTPILWADMFLDGRTFPYPYCGNYVLRCCDTLRNLERLDKRAILCDWQYNIDRSKPETMQFFNEHYDTARMLTAPWHTESNIKGRCQLAKEYGWKGMIETTWDLVHKRLHSITYAACGAWQEDLSYADRVTGETIKIITVEYLRKLLPCEGDYTEAGVFDHEIDSVVGTTG